MPFEPFYTEIFLSDFEKLGKPVRDAAIKKIGQIRENPAHFEFLHARVPLDTHIQIPQGFEYRASRVQKARIGGFRIIFRVEGNTIRFYRIGKRDIIYKEFRQP